jgi:hypothetical protein
MIDQALWDDQMFAEAFADVQAMSLTNRHLISCLYEVVLKDDPQADQKLRRISEELAQFYQDGTVNPLAEGNMVRLSDSFIASVRQRLGL